MNALVLYRRRLSDALRTIPRTTWLGIAIALILWWIFMYHTRWPSVQDKTDILLVLASGAPNTFTELVPRDGWPYWLSWIPTGINMNDNNAIGMAFAFLIAGAVSALVLPAGAMKRILLSKGVGGAAIGGMLGAPLMMCSACSVPVAVGWRKRGANMETTLGVVTGSAFLNIVGIITIWMLFPWPLAGGRIVASLAMVMIITPITARMTVYMLSRYGKRVPDISPATLGKLVEVPPAILQVPSGPEPWSEALATTLRAWWWSSVNIAYRLFIPMTLAIFLAAFLRLFVPPGVVETYFGEGLMAIAFVALFGTLIAIPTMFEIPLTIGFLLLGMGFGPATALLITAPSVSVVSYFLLRKDVGHLPPILLMIATFFIGVIAGLLVEFGLTYYA